MSKISAAQERFITNAVAIAATELLFDALKRNFPSRPLSEAVTIYNGQGLRAIDRDESGQYEVYAAGGLVGKHTAKLTEKPFVVIGRKGSAGKPSYAPFGGWVIDTAYYAQPNDDQDLDCEFLFHAISSLDFKGDIISTAIPGINRTSIYRYSIPIPSRQIQETCVRFLNAAAYKSRLGSLPELPPGLEKVGVVVARIEELSAKVEEARGLRQYALQEVEAFKQSSAAKIFGELDSSHFTTVDDTCEVRGGIQKSSSRTPGANPRRYITVAHVQRNWIDIGDPRYFEVTDAELERWRLLPGDVLVIEGNGSADHIGRTAVFRGEIKDCVHQNHVIRVRPNNDRLLSDYLNVYLNSSLGRNQMLERSRTTSGLYNLSVGRIKDLEIPVPNLIEQRRIVTYLDNLQAKVDALKKLQEETGKELTALMPSILSKAFAGEL